MRIAIDMQGALTLGSRPRGIGRYTTQLVKAIAELRGEHDVRLVLNAYHAEAAAEVERDFAPLLSAGALSRFHVPPTQTHCELPDSPTRQVGDVILKRHVATLAPDILLCTSLFEGGLGDVSPVDMSAYPARLTCAILYDLIPVIFPDLYLLNPSVAANFKATAESLQNIDLLLAISESAKRDAVRLLGIPSERIVNISGAADDSFRPVPMDEEARRQVMEKAGLSSPFVMYVSGADPRKNLRGAIDLFGALPAEIRDAHQLLLVTRITPKDHEDFQSYATSLGIRPGGLVIVGAIDDESLVALFNICKTFIFPSLYEGFGLPVLEAMQCGTPVLAADNSSIPEIVDRADLRFDPVDVQAGAVKLAHILQDEAFRKSVSEWGIARAREFNWKNSARLALQAMEERLPQRKLPHVLPSMLLDLDGARAELAEKLAVSQEFDERLEEVVDNLLDSVPLFQEGASRRLLIDATMTRETDAWTGIQRVVRKLTANVHEHPPRADIIPVSVEVTPEAIRAVPDFTASSLGIEAPFAGHPVELRQGDDLLMLDSNWTAYPSLDAHFAAVDGVGGRVITCIYDLIPELMPEVCIQGMPEVHLRWLTAAVLRSHALICISRAVADELIDYIRAHDLPHRPGLKIGWFHCGSDILRSDPAKLPHPEVVGAFDGSHKVFVMVGTLEPRKDQALALDAFEQFWARGGDASLCIIGKAGWKVQELVNRIEGHPEYRKRLFWFSSATDVDVVHAYHHAEAVICTSRAEGFGLPLAEAAHMDKPVICSDIPVFREVGGEGAIYFPARQAGALATTLEDWLAGKLHADPRLVSRPSWSEAARRISEVIYQDEWYATLD